jgi:hypothetical protein
MENRIVLCLLIINLTQSYILFGYQRGVRNIAQILGDSSLNQFLYPSWYYLLMFIKVCCLIGCSYYVISIGHWEYIAYYFILSLICDTIIPLPKKLYLKLIVKQAHKNIYKHHLMNSVINEGISLYDKI